MIHGLQRSQPYDFIVRYARYGGSDEVTVRVYAKTYEDAEVAAVDEASRVVGEDIGYCVTEVEDA